MRAERLRKDLKMKMQSWIIITAVASIFACGKKETPKPNISTAPTVTVPTEKNWTFETTPVWAEEFNYTGKPDATKWGYDIGGSGWGNNELQYYTDNISNASVADGKLTITARKENMGGKEYTSARLVTKGKGDWLYGRFEIKAKLPTGKGTWPAIWMLPTDWATIRIGCT